MTCTLLALHMADSAGAARTRVMSAGHGYQWRSGVFSDVCGFTTNPTNTIKRSPRRLGSRLT